MEHLPVSPGPHLVDHRWLEIDKDGAGNVLAGARLGKEGVEGVVGDADGLVGGHLAVGLDAVLEAVELPARVPHLATRPPHVDGDAFPLEITNLMCIFFQASICSTVYHAAAIDCGRACGKIRHLSTTWFGHGGSDNGTPLMTILWMLDMKDTSICINALAVIKDQLSFYQKKKTNKSGREQSANLQRAGNHDCHGTTNYRNC